MVLCIILQQILQGTESGVYICTATLTSRTRSKYIFKTPPGDRIITAMEQKMKRETMARGKSSSVKLSIIKITILSQCKAPYHQIVDHIRLNFQS